MAHTRSRARRNAVPRGGPAGFEQRLVGVPPVGPTDRAMAPQYLDTARAGSAPDEET